MLCRLVKKVWIDDFGIKRSIWNTPILKFNKKPFDSTRVFGQHRDLFGYFPIIPRNKSMSETKNDPGSLVAGFNPSEKYSSKWESSPIFGVKVIQIFELPPSRTCLASSDVQQSPPVERREAHVGGLALPPCPRWIPNWEVMGSSRYDSTSPIGSMGLVYLPTFTIKKQPNVGKYTIHGSYGSEQNMT